MTTQGLRNIDDLLDIVNESVAAYKVCKQRINAFEKALQEALTDVGSEMGRTGGAPPGVNGGDESETDERRPPTGSAPKSSGSGLVDTDGDVRF